MEMNQQEEEEAAGCPVCVIKGTHWLSTATGFTPRRVPHWWGLSGAGPRGADCHEQALLHSNTKPIQKMLMQVEKIKVFF